MALRMKEVIGMVLRKRLRKLVEAEEILILPGAYDALSAKLVQAAGFQAVYLTGYGQSASKLGEPDVGLMCMSEMAERTRDIAMAVDIPVAAIGGITEENCLELAGTGVSGIAVHADSHIAGLH